MGKFYANKIKKLLGYVDTPIIGAGPLSFEEKIIAARGGEQYLSKHREKLRNARDEVYSLIVELLRFQSWRLEIKNIVDRGTN